MDHYRNLGLPNNASIENVKTAYRQLAKKYHPDRNKNASASDKFIAINNSYEYIISGKGDQALNTYKYYAQEANKPKSKPVNEYDLNGDGRVSPQEYRTVSRHKLEEAARAFYNLHQTSFEFRHKIAINYIATFSVCLIIFLTGIFLIYKMNFPGPKDSQDIPPIFFSYIVMALLSPPLIGFFFGLWATKSHKTYIKFIRKKYDPNFKILDLFNF